MSTLNQGVEEHVDKVECPLCMEPLEVDDLHFYPCTCGYQICRFCWNRILETENGLCPACRKAYPENPADFTPLSQEQVAAIKTEKKAREQKRRNKTLESRRALANVRVVQNNLVFVVGLPVRLADPEILKRQEYFGKYGKIHKVVINQSTTYAGSQGPSASAYVTYVTQSDALRAIQGVNNVTLDGRVLKSSLGTTKYCANFMKNQPCPKPDCMYLHDLGDPKASFTKEEMHAGLHQVYERKLHMQLAQRDAEREMGGGSGSSSTNGEKASSKDGNQSNFIPTTVVTSSHINIVNSKCKKDSSGSSSSGSSTSGKEAWPSLGSSPPNDTPAPRKTKAHNTGKIPQDSSRSSTSGKEAWPSLGSSPPNDTPAPRKTKAHNTVKSQENGTSESSSPTLMQQPQAQTKTSKDKDTDSKSKDTEGKGKDTESKSKDMESKSKDTDNKSKDSKSKKDSSHSTNSHNGKKSKNSEKKQKLNNGNSINENSETESVENKEKETPSSVFESDSQQMSYLSNELDELESDRHSLLENHDLLEPNDHNLLEDDDQSHSLLTDTNEVLMLQRQREMLSGLVDNHLMPSKNPVMNGFGLLDRDSMYLNNDRQISQMKSGQVEQKDGLVRDRSRSDMVMRQNELMARQQSMMDQKSYLHSSTLPMDSTSDVLGANYHSNHKMLPPFGMRVDNSMAANALTANSMASNPLTNSMIPNLNNSLNSLTTNSIGVNSLSANSMGVKSLSVNNMGVNSLPANNMGVNSLTANNMGLNSLSANNMGANSLGANTMVVNSLSANNMGVNSLGANSMGVNSLGANSMGINSLGVNSLSVNAMGVNSLGASSFSGNGMASPMGQMASGSMAPFMMHNQQMMQSQMQQSGLVNGYDGPPTANEGRYVAENMDKFFTDFHKAQQLRIMLGVERPPHQPQNMLHARAHHDHKQRMGPGSMSTVSGASSRAAGDADDDLDFDPFKETQKALAEMMESELMQNTVSSGDNLERVGRSRPPPGFSHAQSAFGLGRPQSQHQPQGFNTGNNAMYTDWTQMDPAIMSTSVNKGLQQMPSMSQQQPLNQQQTLNQQQQQSLNQQQHELFARFNQMGVNNKVPNMNMSSMGGLGSGAGPHWPHAPVPQHKLWANGRMPLPPGFAAPQQSSHLAQECIDAK